MQVPCSSQHLDLLQHLYPTLSQTKPFTAFPLILLPTYTKVKRIIFPSNTQVPNLGWTTEPPTKLSENTNNGAHGRWQFAQGHMISEGWDWNPVLPDFKDPLPPSWVPHWFMKEEKQKNLNACCLFSGLLWATLENVKVTSAFWTVSSHVNRRAELKSWQAENVAVIEEEEKHAYFLHCLYNFISSLWHP